MMTKEEFLEQIQNNCSEILYLCVKHILDKLYNENANLNEMENKEFFSNYKNYHLYLNDFAGTIYSKHSSSVNTIYIEMCNYLEVEIDNKYTLEHVIVKLEKQTPQVLLGLTDEDIQKQTIIHFDERILEIMSSTHYNANFPEYQQRVENLKNNIMLVKNALQIS
jgi:hypothetical protein